MNQTRDFKDHSEKLTFLSSSNSKIMNIQLFYPRKFQPLKCRLSWRISSRKKRLWRLPFWNFLSSQTMFMWHHSVWLEIGKKEKNLPLTLHPPQGLNLFFQVIIHFTIFNAFISEFRACLAQNNFIIAWEQLGSTEAIWTKSLGWMTSQKHNLAAEYCPKW